MENGIRPPIQMAVDGMRNLFLGYAGEQNAQLIQIDVSKWQEKWPGSSIDLMLTLPGEKASYPAKTELQDGKLLFLPGYGDTQKPGHGAAYVVATKDGTHLAASDTVLTEIIHKGRGGDELPEAPEAQAGWVADVLDAANRAEEAAKRAENAGGGSITDEQIGKAVEDYLQENPVESPVQSVCGKTGAVQLSAADVGALPKDTPIPAPYTLPTASAEVKGGVKVGKGLRMDGDVLGVKPEGEYELIENITLTEEISEIVRTQAPNGEPYDFSAFILITLCPAQSSTAGELYGHVGGKTWGEVSCGMPFKGTLAYATRSLYVLKKGIWDIYGYHGNASAASTMRGQTSAQNLWTYEKMNSIKYLRLFTIGAAMPVGMKIEIWGVRANA